MFFSKPAFQPWMIAVLTANSGVLSAITTTKTTTTTKATTTTTKIATTTLKAATTTTTTKAAAKVATTTASAPKPTTAPSCPSGQYRQADGTCDSTDCALYNQIITKLGDQPIPINCCDNQYYGYYCTGTRITEISWVERLFTSNLPPEFGNLTALTRLTAWSSPLGQLPETLGNLLSLTKLDVDTISGTIPSCLGSMTNLKYLTLSGQLSGPIPSSLGSLANLQTLRLGGSFTGPIPSTIGSLTNLQTLSISGTKINGSIPAEIGSLTNLQSIILSNNQLSGPIPSSFGNLQALTFIDLSNNQLSGALPDTFGNLINAQFIHLFQNKLTGLPSSLGSLAKANVLSIYSNQLTGPIPSSIGNLQTLTCLYLQNNQLDGPIPSTFGSLTNLQHLWLNSNKLSGTIPSTLSSLSQLYRLQLNDNQLSGFPSSLMTASNWGSYQWVLFPNPMSDIPYDIVKPASIATLTNVTLIPFLNTPTNLRKRQVLSSVAPISTDELIKLCPLNNVQSSDVAAGCIAGIYNKFCLWPTNPTLLSQCQDAYNRAFDASIFKSLGAVCPAWRKGPLSNSCATAVSQFSYNYLLGYDLQGAPMYLNLNSTNARDLVKTIFGSPKYAPCQAPVVCSWQATNA
jgi:Leucine-rich repeat (LRR) protein